MSTASLALRVLAINAGSSSLIFGLFGVGPRGTELLLSGSATAIGEGQSVFAVYDGKGNGLCQEAHAIPSHQDALSRLARFLNDAHVPTPEAIGHRVVHGGPRLLRHCRIDEAVIDYLKSAVEFAPLHVPAARAAIRFGEREFAGVAQVACFDTAFHRALLDVARVLPIARGFADMAFMASPANRFCVGSNDRCRSAMSGDMRVLRQAASSNPAARLAIDIFCTSVRKQIAAMAARLEGLDLLVFTGGIGENGLQTRAEICGGLGWMGMAFDDRRNGCAENPISKMVRPQRSSFCRPGRTNRSRATRGECCGRAEAGGANCLGPRQERRMNP
jgi:acetate kinase